MGFVERKKLSEFRKEIKKFLPTKLDEKNYQETVALKLRDYSVAILGAKASKISNDDWKLWIGKLGEAADVEASTVFGFKSETVNDLKNKRAAPIHAYAAHYRMHMHIHETELKFARLVDQLHIKRPIERLFDGPVFRYEIDEEACPDGVNFTPSLARLTEVDWDQNMPNDVDVYQLSARLFMGSVREIHGHRDLRYGLREVWFRVRSENFEVKKYYECATSDLPDYVRYLDDGNWAMSSPVAPIDGLKALSGSMFACPVCAGAPQSDREAKLHVEVYARKNSPQLRSVSPISGDEQNLEETEKENLIEKVFAIYINKLNGLDGHDEFILLSSKTISP